MNSLSRFWEIDTLRGIAISMMILYHLLFDLYFFGIYSINIGSGLSWFFARATAIIFILLVGISLTLSYNRGKILEKKGIKGPNFVKYLKRGLKIFLLGVLISLITWIFIPADFIVFGVLHFIGLVIILEYPFIGKKYLNLVLGILIISLGVITSQIYVSWPWLLWLGINTSSFQSVDYFPLIPWMGVVSLGLFLGNILYKDYKRQFSLPDFSGNPIIKGCSFLGRNSLIIYLLHQPILIIVLILTGAINLSFFIK
jgi:uncharacterized membrane protein